MSDTVGLPAELLAKLQEHVHSAKRELIAIAGPPASGKSTLAAKLCEQINATHDTSPAVVFPMDGYHLDNILLDAMQARARKGAPHTFDVEGFAHTLRRVAESPNEVVVPVFDRELDIARAGGIRIQKHHTVVLVEGNYLLLDKPQWRELSATFNYTIYVDVEETTLKNRLTQRWIDHGMSLAAAESRAESNDLPNARLVASARLEADHVLVQT